jgi:catalase-peroxidase
MAMNDEETVALIVGGHTFGKTHGAVDPKYLGPEPEAAPLEQQGLGWRNSYGSGKGPDTLTSGLEGAWTYEPTRWDNGYLDVLFRYDWELTTSPAGAKQWTPKDPEAQGTVPDAHDPAKRHAPIMLTLGPGPAGRPDLRPDRQAVHENPDQLADAFARRGSSCCTATWVPSRATSARGCRSRSCGRTRSRPVDHELVGVGGRRQPLKARSSASGLVHLPAGVSHRLGVGGQLPRPRQAWRGQRGADSPCAATGLGGQ